MEMTFSRAVRVSLFSVKSVMESAAAIRRDSQGAAG